MDVRIEVAFDNPTPEDESSLRRMALGLTNDQSSVRLSARHDDPRWLVAELTMTAEAQYRAVERIDRAMRFSLWNRMDSVIAFPKKSRVRKPGRRRQ